jgi:radical SAM protein with 4Fe4S-binding SPASM domain
MGRLEDRLEALYRSAGRLLSLHLDVTWRCALDCLHCYLPHKGGGEMTTQQVARLLDEARDMGVFTIGFSGGEVFARPDFIDLVEHARDNRFQIHVKTSGAFLPAGALERFARSRPNLVDISFYSDVEATHDAVTGRPGSFESSLATARRLQSSGLLVQAAVTLLKGYGEDAAAIRNGLSRLGLLHIGFNELDESCKPDAHLGDLRPTEDQLSRQFALSPAGTARIDRTDDSPLCSAATSSLHIAPDGTVRPCALIPHPAGNVLATPLAVLWKESPVLRRFRTLTWSSPERCRDCPDRPWCRYCLGKAERLTGDDLLPPGEFCRLARRRRSVAPPPHKADGGEA